MIAAHKGSIYKLNLIVGQSNIKLLLIIIKEQIWLCQLSQIDNFFTQIHTYMRL